jgi:hypothetical protein
VDPYRRMIESDILFSASRQLCNELEKEFEKVNIKMVEEVL